MDNNIKIQTLSRELKALNDEDLNQISGSGNDEYVTITDEQCEKINTWFDMRPYLDSQFRVVTNYGGICPRIIFNEALKIDKEPQV